jgi:hypothetical protein
MEMFGPVDYSKLSEKLREEFRDILHRLESSGFEFNILFAKPGYAVHGVRNVIDPTDGREKLVLFCPGGKTRDTAYTYDPGPYTGVFIYDLEDQRIEWSFYPPGTGARGGSYWDNPAEGFMLPVDIPSFGSAGDICVFDKDWNLVVADRKTANIKFQKPLPYPSGVTPYLPYGLELGVDNSSIIMTDFAKNLVMKIKVPDMTIVWTQTGITQPIKVSRIRGAHTRWCPSDFGGDYIVAANVLMPNQSVGGAFELRDSDGAIVWQSVKSDFSGVWVNTPGNAIRIGKIERYGNITIIGSEAGGGIVAVDYFGRPVWGFGSRRWYSIGRTWYYDTSVEYLGEMVYVFPRLNGRIGFVSWLAENMSIVGEIVRLPKHMYCDCVLAWNKATTDSYVYFDPPLRALEWKEVTLAIKNRGTNSLTWKIDLYMTPVFDDSNPDYGLVPYDERAVAGGGTDAVVFRNPYNMIRVGVKSTTAGASTNYDLYVAFRR